MVSGTPAAAASVLALPTAERYPVQIVYQVPLFFAATAAGGAVLAAVLPLRPSAAGLRTGFAAVAFAGCVPFLFTTFPVEAVVAVLRMAWPGVRRAVDGWWTGAGRGFVVAYQIVAVVWIVALFLAAAVRVGTARWPKAGLARSPARSGTSCRETSRPSVTASTTPEAWMHRTSGT
jgi:hypothetical protein